MKVLGIGLNKTGTTTLGTCLKEFGLHHHSWTREGFKLWMENRHDELLKIADDYDSFEDFPWALMVEQFDERYPGSKFILTRRKDGATWFKSLCKHADWTGPHEVYLGVYGNELPYDHEEKFVAFYEDYLVRMRNHFKDRPSDFLEVCWEDGDGWEELCRFLGQDIPSIPFPHANKSPNKFDKFTHRLRKVYRGLKRFAARVLSGKTGSTKSTKTDSKA